MGGYSPNFFKKINSFKKEKKDYHSRGKIQGLKKIIKAILLISIILLGISFFKKKEMPSKEEILDVLYQAPIQSETQAPSFTTERKGVVYRVVPLYNYELWGLIVSYNDCERWWDYHHKAARDYLNTKDICVVWGKNIKSEVYRRMKFDSGSWTCYSHIPYFEIKNFDHSCLSNNHLLPANRQIYKEIKKTDIGDQIHIKGYLVKYSRRPGTGGWRESSTTRLDNGCEIIYVTDFQILKRGNIAWHYIYTISKYSIIACLIILTIIFLIL
ncbi:hypothetical protein J7J39_02870 [bacterium]|nr:hypothetical protein [bacterium]